ncbi:MAG: carbohydrate ABC transporter permease [Anaerolineales bacterium]|nr:carbohydrate ABC transporter permease [Anaerolineales bacterium]
MDSPTVPTGQPNFWRRRRTRQQAQRLATYGVLILLSLIFLAPFYWMVSTAFKEPDLIYKSPPVWIPPRLTLENFEHGLRLMLPSFQALFLNSVVVTSLTIVGVLFSSSLVGFAFAIFPGRGKRLLFLLVLSTLMIPPAVTLIPQFILFTELGWRDSYLPLVAPYFFASAFFVFMFRQFFAAIPRDLFDSAEIDGCSALGLYFRIAVPLSKPVFATAAIFAFLGAWNDLLNPLIYLNDMTKFTMTLGLSNFQGSGSAPFTRIEYLMPMALLALIPILILFFLAQKYFVRGIVTTGMKG